MSSTPDQTDAFISPAKSAMERFSPGQILIGRFRIVAPIGKGGMGEVYRADDLTLGQSVALKFLPAHLTNDPARLALIRREVATARRVSHPNVCRVYDLVEQEGQSFLTMEYIDGEDLSSLLTRVGRISEEKGFEIARQLCSALAAVHAEGLLHRDLKPANVMLDGRGRVRLSDFGLAALAESLGHNDIRGGTPLYQAPEQLSGQQVTARSDLFALGLLFYELFTGKRAFANSSRDTTPSTPTSHVANLNPAVEQIILRCLELDPEKRPRSAFEVMVSLPGGDPLAAALAAGETPSPQLVADAGGTGILPVRTAGILLASLVALSVICMWLIDHHGAIRLAGLTTSPAEFDVRSRDLLALLGVTEQPRHRYGWYAQNIEWIQNAHRIDPEFYRHLDSRFGPYAYHYRESPSPLDPVNYPDDPVIGSVVTWINPPVSRPGMSGVMWDPRGNLIEFYRQAPSMTEGVPPDLAANWFEALFRAANLNVKNFTPAIAERTPPVATDTRLAWTGQWPDATGGAIRVEAAAFRGSPVFFRVRPILPGRQELTRNEFFNPWFFDVYDYAMLTIAVAVGWWNLRRKRSDTRIAIRLFLASLSVTALLWLVIDYHSLTLAGEIVGVYLQFPSIVKFSLFASFAYLAFEPVFRRRWPHLLISWNRLFSGRWRDSLVGRDLLIGYVGGVLAALVYQILIPSALETNARVTGDDIVFVRAPGFTGLSFLGGVNQALLTPRILFALFVLLLLFRRQQIVWPLFFVSIAICEDWSFRMALQNGYWLPITANMIQYMIMTLLLARIGLLSTVGFWIAFDIFLIGNCTLTPTDWYFWREFLSVAILLVSAGYCFHTATGAKSLFREGFLADR